MVSKPLVCENDETGEDDKADDNEVVERARVPGELKSVLGYKSFKKPRVEKMLLTPMGVIAALLQN